MGRCWKAAFSCESTKSPTKTG